VDATSGRAGREMMAATFFAEDDDELAMWMTERKIVQNSKENFYRGRRASPADHQAIRKVLGAGIRGSLPRQGLATRLHHC
jgi:hypothetical protein